MGNAVIAMMAFVATSEAHFFSDHSQKSSFNSAVVNEFSNLNNEKIPP